MNRRGCEYVTASAEETRSLGRRIGERLQAGDVLALEGDLGAGKTTFSQGVAHGLGIREPIDSPTFTLIKEYEGRIPFYHMDVYRLEDVEEELGWDEYFYGEGATLVEWAERIRHWLPERTVWITLTLESHGKRRIRLDIPFEENADRFCVEGAVR